MSETDPIEQISDALARVRWRGRPVRAGERGRQARGRDGRREEFHGGHLGHPGQHDAQHRRGSGGPALGRLLWALSSKRAPLSVSDIAETVGVDQPRASRLVAQGVEFGLLRREADPADARRIRIVLTGEGEAMVRRMRSERSAAVRDALSGFSDDEKRQFAGLLARFAEAWPDAGSGAR